MVEADDGKPCRARPTADNDVIFGIEDIPVRVVRQVSRLDRLEDLALPTDQHAAALARVRPLGVADGLPREPSACNLQFTIAN